MKNVENDIVLVTGGGSGIGQLTALNFLQLGSKVVIWDVSAQGMQTTVQMAKQKKLDVKKLFTYQVNLADSKAIYETAKKTKEDVGVITILINNAGVVSGSHILDIPDEKIELTVKVNCLAHFYTIKAFLPDMIKLKKGHIVTVASVAGDVGVSYLTDYCASKFANVGMDLSLRYELAQADLNEIKTTVIKPYFIDTGMFDGADAGFFPLLKPDYVARKIVQGIRCDKLEVYLPGYFQYLFLSMALLPSKCLIPLNDFLGGYDFMASFVGRNHPTKPNEINNNSINNSGNKQQQQINGSPVANNKKVE